MKKTKLSTRLHISRAFSMKKVTLAIRMKNFGLQKNQKRVKINPKIRSGDFPWQRGQGGGGGLGACVEMLPETAPRAGALAAG